MEEETKTAIVTARVIDLANPVSGTWTKPCDECGELTWISSYWKNRKIDKIICEPCWFEKYNDGDHAAFIKEENIEEALELFRSRGMDVRREELIKNIEDRFGKKMKII